jgi:hypothetical protein
MRSLDQEHYWYCCKQCGDEFSDRAPARLISVRSRDRFVAAKSWVTFWRSLTEAQSAKLRAMLEALRPDEPRNHGGRTTPSLLSAVATLYALAKQKRGVMVNIPAWFRDPEASMKRFEEADRLVRQFVAAHYKCGAEDCLFIGTDENTIVRCTVCNATDDIEIPVELYVDYLENVRGATNDDIRMCSSTSNLEVTRDTEGRAWFPACQTVTGLFRRFAFRPFGVTFWR